MSLSRREFLVKTAGATALAALARPGAGAATAAPDKPNVLFLAIDDLANWIGAMEKFPNGHPGIKTPNIDRLVRRGMLFANCHCQAPICNPSRASLLTGVRPSTSGVYMNTQLWRKAMPDAVTLPQQFMANGYEVAGSGKIFHGNQNDAASWNSYYTAPRDGLNSEGDEGEFEGGGAGRIPGMVRVGGGLRWAAIDSPDETTSDWKVANWAVEFLGKPHDKPFFLACGIFRPHLPWVVPKKYFDQFPAETVAVPEINAHDLDDIPPIGVKMARQEEHKRVVDSGKWNGCVAANLACIAYADARIGEVVDALDRSPYAKNTIIVFWTDHGWHLGQKLHWEKFTLWEESSRTPLAIVAPWAVPANSTCQRVTSLLDVYPTLVELAGLAPKPAALEGASLMPLLKDPKLPWDHPAVTTYWLNNHAVRTERFRYIRYNDGKEELYDHDADKYEWTNLADNPQFDQVKRELAGYLPKVNHPGAPWSGKGPPARRMKDLTA